MHKRIQKSNAVYVNSDSARGYATSALYNSPKTGQLTLIALQQSVGNHNTQAVLGASHDTLKTPNRLSLDGAQAPCRECDDAVSLQVEEDETENDEELPQSKAVAGAPPPADADELGSHRTALHTNGPVLSFSLKSLTSHQIPLLQRQEANATTSEATERNVTEPNFAESTATEASSSQATMPGLILEEAAQRSNPQQMSKGEFLVQLRSEICSAADTAMAGSEFSAQGCPWIDMYLRFYEARSAERIERDLLRYAPEAQGASAAQDYIPFIAARVQRSVAVWMQTGDITGVPEGIPTGLMGFGLVGRLLFKAGPGGPTGNPHPMGVQAQLGRGQALASSIQSRMGSAFGRNFSHVRVHTDAAAAGLTNRYNARAFTIGSHVAFGSGEFRPGTLMGDGLIAHELAHTAQQAGAAQVMPASQIGQVRTHALEQDADRAAIGAVVSLWGLARQGNLTHSTPHTRPREQSGLQLQRCSARRPQLLNRPSECPSLSRERWRSDVNAAQAMSNTDDKRDAMASLTQQAVCSLNIQVAVAGESHKSKVHPDDYKQAPVLNFDVRLNSKARWTSDRKLTDNAGFFFSRGRDEAYAIVGPIALRPTSPEYTRRTAEHELFHARRHAGSQEASDDHELETWAEDFVRYFHRLGRWTRSGHYLGAGWGPLLQYYEGAGEAARSQALQRIVDYYNDPPVSESEKESVRQAFRGWFQRRRGDRGSSQFVIDLNGRLSLPAPEAGA